MNKKYQKYLKSDKWKEKREKILKKRGRVCQLCQSIHQLHLHHLTYRRRYNEKDIDLLIVCYKCHASIHGKKAKDQQPPPKEKQLPKRRERNTKTLNEQYEEALKRDMQSRHP